MRCGRTSRADWVRSSVVISVRPFHAARVRAALTIMMSARWPSTWALMQVRATVMRVSSSICTSLTSSVARPILLLVS